MKRKILFFLSIQIAIHASVLSAAGVGTTGCQFLKLGVGAKPVSMGEANAGLADDVNAIWWNPAGLNQVERKEITASHTLWFEDIFFSNIGYCQAGLGGVIGGAFRYLSAGKIDKIDKDGNELDESYTPYDMAVTFSYARVFMDIPVGVNMKIISSKIDDESAIAFAFDLGIMYKIMQKRVSLGLVLQNLGVGPQFNKERDPLPLNVKAGYACRLFTKNLTMVFDVNFPIDYPVNYHCGFEYIYSIRNIQLSPRIGFKTTTISDLEALSGLSLGFGTRYQSYGIDYAWVPYGDLGNTHRISLSTSF